MPTKLYIGNLPEDTDKSELEDMFSKYGKIVEFDILKDYGFIHFAQESEANAAAAGLDGVEYRNTIIKVEVSRSKVRQKPGMGGKGGCYRCGGEGHWSKECPRGPSRSYNRDRDGYGGGRGGGRDGGRDGGRGSGGRFQVYDRPPYGGDYGRDAYADYYARSRMMAAYADRYGMGDPYERRMAPGAVRGSSGSDPYNRNGSDPYSRNGTDPYSRAAASDPYSRDPYASKDPYARPSPDYYANRQRSSPPKDPYYDYYARRSLSSSGAAGAADDRQQVSQRSNGAVNGRVPGPY